MDPFAIEKSIIIVLDLLTIILVPIALIVFFLIVLICLIGTLIFAILNSVLIIHIEFLLFEITI